MVYLEITLACLSLFFFFRKKIVKFFKGDPPLPRKDGEVRAGDWVKIKSNSVSNIKTYYVDMVTEKYAFISTNAGKREKDKILIYCTRIDIENLEVVVPV